METLFGMPVVIHKLAPTGKRRYSFDPEHKVPVTPECRRRTEQWVREFFRASPCVLVVDRTLLEMQVPAVRGSQARHCIFVHPNVYPWFKASVVKGMSLESFL